MSLALIRPPEWVSCLRYDVMTTHVRLAGQDLPVLYSRTLSPSRKYGHPRVPTEPSRASPGPHNAQVRLKMIFPAREALQPQLAPRGGDARHGGASTCFARRRRRRRFGQPYAPGRTPVCGASARPARTVSRGLPLSPDWRPHRCAPFLCRRLTCAVLGTGDTSTCRRGHY